MVKKALFFLLIFYTGLLNAQVSAISMSGFNDTRKTQSMPSMYNYGIQGSASAYNTTKKDERDNEFSIGLNMNTHAGIIGGLALRYGYEVDEQWSNFFFA